MDFGLARLNTEAKLAVAKHLIIRRGNDPPPLGGPVTVHFVVHCKQIRPWEFVFLTGSSAKLGAWQAEKAVELERCEQGNLWRTSIQIGPEESRQMLGFRYFIGYYLQANADPNSRIRIVARWESQRAPRCVLPSVEASAGVCRLKHVDEFGVYGGKELVTDGWLHDKEQKEILLRVHGEALKFYKSRHTKRQYFIKVTPFDLRHKEVGSADDDGDDASDANSFLPSLPSFSVTDLAVLSRDDPTFHDQAPSGELFRNSDDYFVFRTHSVAVDYLAFRIEFFVDANALAREKGAMQENGSASGEEAAIAAPQMPKFERAAIAYCMPSSMAGSYGSTSVPILAKTQQPIGQIKIDYLFIRALQRRETTPALAMDVTYCRHWKKRKTLEVGHRGMGNSYTKFAAARENTIHSLNHAANKGADFVEFDVQLTKDKHAVIFHDFHVLVSVAKRSSSLLDLSNGTKASGTADGTSSHIADFHELAVKDLKLTQLQLLHLEHHRATEEANKDKLRVTGTPNEPPELRPFPTLADSLKYVDPDTGFNIEIKYPMMMKDGSHECENYFERNEYIDIILNDVLEHAASRRIVFSSFDPDICSLIALKQNKFPVLFLWYSNEGMRYVPFLDERSSTSRIAVNFAASNKILV
ncbi:Protein T05H10.7 b [Aphelenchoides avenae]|nr:Protein T05H10.7 b [Aphelenchus avenae]